MSDARLCSLYVCSLSVVVCFTKKDRSWLLYFRLTACLVVVASTTPHCMMCNILVYGINTIYDGAVWCLISGGGTTEQYQCHHVSVHSWLLCVVVIFFDIVLLCTNRFSGDDRTCSTAGVRWWWMCYCDCIMFFMMFDQAAVEQQHECASRRQEMVDCCLLQ